MSAVVEPVESSSCDEQARRLAEAMQRQLGVFCSLLDEPNVIEVMLNADGRVWLDGLPANPVESASAGPSHGYEHDRRVSTFCAAPACQPRNLDAAFQPQAE